MRAKYLYNQIFDALKQEIAEGQFEFGSLLPSENQLCKRFSVERTTIRKALTLLVQEGMVEKCPGVGSRVIFRPDGEAPAVKFSGNSIGFFILESDTSNKKITEPYYSDLFYYLEKECASHGLQLIYSTLTENSDIVDIISKHDFIATVFVTRMPHHLVAAAKETGIPLLTVNDEHAGIPCIQHDYLAGSYTALKYLYGMGHRRIALVGGPSGFLATDDKMTGCLKAMYNLDLEIPREWILHGRDWTFQSGYDVTKELLSRQEAHPTAIFAFNDIMAVGSIRAIRDAGFSVPQDISMIGFDNMGQLQFTEPDLTTIDGNTSYLAKIIMDTAFKNALEQYDLGIKFVIPTKLVPRGTVRRLE